MTYLTKGIILLLMILGMTSISKSQDSTQQDALLWEISGNGLAQPSYLFGTIHLIPKDSFFLPPATLEKLASASHLVLEIPLDMNMTSMLASAMGMMMPAGQSLKSLLTDSEYQELTQFMKDSMKTPIPFYQMLKPIYVAQQVTASYCMEGEQESYELYFSEIFQEADKPISGLETIQEQMKFLDDIPLDEQAQQLMESIENPSEACIEFDKLVSTYRKQNLNHLLKLTEGDESLSEHTDQLLDARNQKWIPKIVDMMEKETIFIAVGAGHLPGNQGVLNLLQEQGYILQPLK